MPRTCATRRSRTASADFEDVVLSGAIGDHLEQAAQGLGDAAVAANHSPHVIFVNDQSQDDGIAILFNLNADAVRIVSE